MRHPTVQAVESQERCQMSVTVPENGPANLDEFLRLF
jgi:hypothetical protein